jgi:hypothetical protein
MRYNDTFLRFGGLSPVEKAGSPHPPHPKVIEVGDCAVVSAEIHDPTDSFRPSSAAVGKDELFSPVGKAWSDEARAAAIEARRAGGARNNPAASGSVRNHLTALQENAEDARREGNKDGAALLMDGAKALAGQAIDPKIAARAHALLEEHESDAEKDGNQELLGAIRAARGALSRYVKSS